MTDVRVIGLDIAKSVFQLHGLDAAGATVLQKRLTRARLLPFFEKLPPCRTGVEARATSHYWARELTKLGHDVKLMPAQYVKPYVKRQKNDMADAEAIAEAVTQQSRLTGYPLVSPPFGLVREARRLVVEVCASLGGVEVMRTMTASTINLDHPRVARMYRGLMTETDARYEFLARFNQGER
jgi:transposase